MTPSHAPHRSFAAGALAALAGLAIGAASFARTLPDTAALQALGRTLDSLAPHLLAVGLVFCLGLALLGARRSAALLTGAAVLSGATLIVTHRGLSLPMLPAEPAAVRVLWFNMWHENAQDPARVAQAIRESGADLAVISEANRLRPALPDLARTYPHQLGCLEQCQMVLLSKHPLTDAQLRRLSVASPERFGRVTLATDQGPVTVVAAHLLKPWFDKLAVWEADRLTRRLADIDGPVVLMGDMNAAPWSRRMTRLAGDTGMRFAPVPPATWPSGAAWLGVPIDNMLVGGGARFVQLQAWGAGAGSNHLGLLADITLQASGN